MLQDGRNVIDRCRLLSGFEVALCPSSGIDCSREVSEGGLVRLDFIPRATGSLSPVYSARAISLAESDLGGRPGIYLSPSITAAALASRIDRRSRKMRLAWRCVFRYLSGFAARQSTTLCDSAFIHFLRC